MTPELLRLSRVDLSRRLICFPPAGGAASGFQSLVAELGSECALYAAQPPGRERRIRERVPASVLDFAADALPAVRAVTNAQTVLFGHSMGGVVAFEVARALEREGCDFAGLIVSACPAPLGPWPYGLGGASDEDLIAMLHELGGTPPEVIADEAMRSLLLRIYRADLIALEEYVPAGLSRLKCLVVAFAGARDESVSLDRVKDWAKVTVAGFRLEVVSGGHMFLRDHAFAARLKQVIRDVTLSAGATPGAGPQLVNE